MIKRQLRDETVHSLLIGVDLWRFQQQLRGLEKIVAEVDRFWLTKKVQQHLF